MRAAGCHRRALVLTSALTLSLPRLPSHATLEGTSIRQAVALGYVEKPTDAELREQMCEVFDRFEGVYAAKDWGALSAHYAQGAITVDATASVKPVKVVGDPGKVAEQSGSPADTSVSIASAQLEVDDRTLRSHVQYNFGGRRGYARLVKTAKTKATEETPWSIDQQLYPLDVAKAYVMLQPRRDAFWRVYMELPP